MKYDYSYTRTYPPKRRRWPGIVAFAAVALCFIGAFVAAAEPGPVGTVTGPHVAALAPSSPAPSSPAPAPKATRSSTPAAAKPPKVTRTTKATTRVKPRRVEPEAVSYPNCTALRRDHPAGVPAGHPAYERRHDRDRDNWACER